MLDLSLIDDRPTRAPQNNVSGVTIGGRYIALRKVHYSDPLLVDCGIGARAKEASDAAAAADAAPPDAPAAMVRALQAARQGERLDDRVAESQLQVCLSPSHPPLLILVLFVVARATLAAMCAAR